MHKVNSEHTLKQNVNEFIASICKFLAFDAELKFSAAAFENYATWRRSVAAYNTTSKESKNIGHNDHYL